MRKTFFWLTIILLQISTSASAQENWNLVKEEEGIKVYTRNETGSQYKAFKAEMEIRSTIDNIVVVLRNMDKVNNWVVNCRGVKLLKEEDSDQYIYIETSLPWPLEARDMVYHFEYTAVNSGEVRVNVSGIPDYIQPVKGLVRMAKADGYWLLSSIDEDTTSMVYQMHVEPGGAIPAWLANAFIKNVPFSTFMELRKVILNKTTAK